MYNNLLLLLLKVDFISKNILNRFEDYETYIKRDAATTTIGYARKSWGNERKQTRTRILQKMIENLRRTGLCSSVFVSKMSHCDESLFTRDVNSDVDGLIHTKGTTQGNQKRCSMKGHIIIIHFHKIDLIHKLNTKQKHTRLVVLDYSGLSSNFNDIKKFIR